MSLKFAYFFITLYGKSKKVSLSPKNGAVSVSKHFWALIRANTVQLPGADLDPRAEVGFDGAVLAQIVFNWL